MGILLTVEEANQAKITGREHWSKELERFYCTDGVEYPKEGEYEDQAISKAQLKKVVEWGNSFCTTIDHYGSDKRANTRKRECRKCWQALLKEVE